MILWNYVGRQMKLILLLEKEFWSIVPSRAQRPQKETLFDALSLLCSVNPSKMGDCSFWNRTFITVLHSIYVQYTTPIAETYVSKMQRHVSWWHDFIFFRKIMLKVTQSICTHYSCFEKMGRFVTLLIKVPDPRVLKL